jgi:ABC-type Fe3+ transport system permease subunit
VAVPAILLAIGLVKVFNRDLFGTFYDSAWMVACAYGARFLPFAVLTLSQMVSRVPRELGEAALLSGRGLWARTGWIALPLLGPAIWSASCLIFILALRELDMAVVLPAGNDMVVRRLANIVHYGGEETGGALAILLLLTATIAPLATILVTGRRLQSIS